MFADYRVPQILRAEGVLSYADDLARRIDAQEEIRAGSEEEVEIRSATVVACDPSGTLSPSSGTITASSRWTGFFGRSAKSARILSRLITEPARSSIEFSLCA